MNKKIKILLLGDAILAPSGVATQLKYIVEGLLKSGKYIVRQLGGAIKHASYQPIKTQEYGDDLIIFPVDGFGTPDMIRSFLRMEKPDILLFQSDPRFYVFLFDMENEIRPLIPMVYYNIWDNYPYPRFNKQFYLSCDYLVAISKVTQDILNNVCPEVTSEYLPHAVDPKIFKIIPEEDVLEFKKKALATMNRPNVPVDMNKTVFLFNSRNARRKQSSSLCWWFADFLKMVGKDNAMLVMHTDPKDPNGADLEAIISELGLVNGEIVFSREKTPPDALAMMYNMADCTINISDAEGFGLSVMESLQCGTPVVGTMTGGIQEQITDGNEFFGVGIKPASQCIVGSQEVPYIYEDRISKEDFLAAMLKMHNMTRKQRKDLGKKGHEYIMKNYNFDKFQQRWVDLLQEVHERFGSWDTRKGYNTWELKKIR